MPGPTSVRIFTRYRRLSALATVYHYRVTDLLVAEYTERGMMYLNTGKSRAAGVEMEINGRPAQWLDVLASLAIQRAVDARDNNPLANSPGQIGKLRFSVPLVARRLSLAVGTQYLGRRQTNAGATLPRLFLPEVVVTSNRIASNFDFQFGIRNALNRNYSDPIALNAMVDTIRAPGRSFFVTLSWRPGE